jgi:hypothetical protein
VWLANDLRLVSSDFTFVIWTAKQRHTRHAPAKSMTTRRSSRAVELLDKVASSALFDRRTLARELVVSEQQLESFLNETVPLPLDRQLCLAQLVIERIPSLARLGHRLHGQVRAAMAFKAGATTTHADAPPMMLR